jgi:hypothetical protein
VREYRVILMVFAMNVNHLLPVKMIVIPVAIVFASLMKIIVLVLLIVQALRYVEIGAVK